jgi:hypothetical protein
VKAIRFIVSILLLTPLSVPVRADFKYTETSKITGGAMKGAMKFAGVFNKQASEAMKPMVTTHYVKGKRLRTDNPDGKVQIIDAEGRRIIDIDTQKHTYSVITFDQMKQSIENAQQQAQKKMDQDPKTNQDPKTKDVKADVNVKFKITPGTGTRQILGHTTNESKVEVQMDVQAQAKDNTQAGQPSTPVSGTILTTMDMWVAPDVAGYQELAQFYTQMGKEINWVPPSNVHLDPRASQSMDEVQKNSANLKGFPLLQYMTMSMAGQQDASGGTAQNSNSSASSSSASSSSNSSDSSLSGAMAKGIGGLFSKKKKQDDAADQNSQNPPPPSTPGSLIEMTIEVNSYSDSALDSALFDVPAGYALVTQSPDQIMGGKPAKE